MFSHLHLHTEYSTLDGFGSPKKWIDRAVELGMKSIAVTDHGNIDSCIKMSQAAKEAGIKLVVGCEFYICKNMAEKNPQNENRHICVFAQNKVGWENILKMLSLANVFGYHYRARIDAKTLLQHIEGVVISTACIFSFLDTPWGEELFTKLHKKMSDRLFFEIMPHSISKQAEWNQKIIDLAEEWDLPIIATNDCHYPRQEDAISQEICLAINSGANWEDPKRFKFGGDSFFLASEDEMRLMLKENHPYIKKSKRQEYLDNTQLLVDLCEEITFERIQPELPLAPNVPIDDLKKDGKDENDYFRDLVMKGLRKKKRELSKPISFYRERIEEELDLLIKKKFTRYFLMVIDILTFCKEKNIYVGPGRGSVGGCLVAWLTEITQVDPLKFDLLFARFQDPAREDLPDIDIDFEQDRREEVVQYIKKVYGQENVAQITTFLTMKAKGALQDVGRVFGISRTEISAVTKFLDDEEDFDLKFFKDSTSAEIQEFYRKHRKIIKHAIAIKNTVRGYGKHAAGVCISNHNLTKGKNGNLAKRHGILVSNWDKDEGELMGLMKLDVLGLTALSRIRVCCEMIKENHGIEIDLNAIDLEDKKTLATINRGDCVGIFQLGTPGLTRYCIDLGIESFKDVYNATALFRPGTLGSGMAGEFIKRKHGEKYRPIHPKVAPFTKETEGIILYQEQCMFLFKDLAGFDWGKCNKVRKVIAKSKGEEALKVFQKDFIDGCVNISKMTEEGACKIWDSIVDFSKYAFNKCLTKDALVLTDKKELKTIEEVQIGEKIDTPEGFSSVLDKHYNGLKEVYLIELENSMSIKCTLDHKFLCKDNKKRPLWEIFENDLGIICNDVSISKIKSLQRIGEVETMDIEVGNDSHTFFANGIATSNSHSVEYSIISMQDAFLKTYYPGEFYASCLSYLSEDKRIEIIEEAAERDIKVSLPKYGFSKSKLWSFDKEKNLLMMPFGEIVGIGDKTAELIEKSCLVKKKTFFGEKRNLSSLPTTVKTSLVKIHADDKNWQPNKKDIEQIKDLFQYDLRKLFL